jgi:hypothetical protein
MMTELQPPDRKDAPIQDKSVLSTPNRRALEAIFRHPSAHNLEWRDVVALLEAIGEVEEKANNEFSVKVAGKRHLLHKPHSKDLTGAEVIDVRQFLIAAGWSSKGSSEPAAHPLPAAPSLMVVVDHHGAKIYALDLASDDVSKHEITPYDPHHFLHHLTHKGQSHERGQRAPEEPAFYESIAQAVALGGKIVVVGHGEGKSNAAGHLSEYLSIHHPATFARIVLEVVADLSSVTPAQLLDVGRKALRE